MHLYYVVCILPCECGQQSKKEVELIVSVTFFILLFNVYNIAGAVCTHSTHSCPSGWLGIPWPVHFSELQGSVLTEYIESMQRNEIHDYEERYW